MRRRFQSAALAAVFVIGSAAPLVAQHGAPTAHAPATPPTAPDGAAATKEKPKAESPQDVADRIMQAIRDYATVTSSPRRAAAPPPRAPRYRVEWPAPRYTVSWPERDDRVIVVWPESIK
jgi:hypothetical protein